MSTSFWKESDIIKFPIIVSGMIMCIACAKILVSSYKSIPTPFWKEIDLIEFPTIVWRMISIIYYLSTGNNILHGNNFKRECWIII